MGIDLTVLATPWFFATMKAEEVWLKKRSDNPAFDRGQYEKGDTTANLALALGSVVAPLGSSWLRKRFALGKGRLAKPTLAFAVAAAATATAADVVAMRRRERSVIDLSDSRTTALAAVPNDDVAVAAEKLGGAAAVAAIGSAAVVTAASWGSLTSANRLWDRRIADLGTGVVAWSVATVGWDFLYYWNHRIQHESRYLWALHVVHHSSQRYNLSVALRQAVLEGVGVFVPYGALAYLGVRPSIIETSRSANLIYQYWVHTEAVDRIGSAEEVLNTPSHHRVHHGVNAHYIDRNHGGILIIWDRLFGTFQREDVRPTYGLTKNLGTNSLPTIVFREFGDIISDVYRAHGWRERLSYTFLGPGWAYRRHRGHEAPALAAAA